MAKLSELDIHAIGDTIQMAGVIYSGQDKTWLVFLPEEKNNLPQEVLELDADDWKKFLHQTDVLETAIFEKASDGALAKVLVRKSQRQIDTVLQWRVFRRDSYACRYCGNADCPLTIDHLVTWENGGPTIEENLVTACKKCNKVRGNLPYEEWLRHPRYRNVSTQLPKHIHESNVALAATLGNIPRYASKRSR